MNNKKKIQTTKVIAAVLMVFILVNSLMIEFYAMYAMFVLDNLEALDVLITTAIGSCLTLVLEFAVYCAKSFLETKAEKKLEFDREKFQIESGQNDSCDETQSDDIDITENNESEDN